MQPKIDFAQGYDSNGVFRIKMLFTKMVGTMPNIVTYAFEEKTPDMESITVDSLQAMYPDAIVKYSIYHNGRTDEDGPAFRITDDGEFVCINNSDSKDFNLFFEDLYVTISDRTMDIFFTDYAKADDFINTFLDIMPIKEEEPTPAKIGLVCTDGNEFYIAKEAIKKVTLDIEKLYNDDFIKFHDKITKFLDTDNKESGVILLSGEAGTGKSYYLRHLINHTPNNYVWLDPAMAAHLSTPELRSFLMGNKNSVFIIEDCEDIILDREEMSVSSAVASILNMSDGLMSDVFNGKFICTFNTETTNVDSALLRKGRCKVNYRFAPLAADKTAALLKENGVAPEIADNAGEMTLANIFNFEDETTNEVTTKTPGYGR